MSEQMKARWHCAWKRRVPRLNSAEWVAKSSPFTFIHKKFPIEMAVAGQNVAAEILVSLAAESVTDHDKMKMGIVVNTLGLCLEERLTFAAGADQLTALIGNANPVIKLQELIKEHSGPVKPKPPRAERKETIHWAELEDQRLIEAVTAQGVDNWRAVAAQVGGGRSSSQCAQRWNRCLNPALSKDSWSEAEGQKLIDLVTEHGSQSWAKIAQLMGNRSDVQCRFRYRYLTKKKEPKRASLKPGPDLEPDPPLDQSICPA
jgi:hypothetical protein